MDINKDTQEVLNLLKRYSKLDYNTANPEYLFDGKEVPRVTMVLSAMLHKDGLMSWANSLGFKRIGYRSYLKAAADKGTYSHLAIERYLKYKEEPDIDNDLYPASVYLTVHSAFGAFMKWWNLVTERNTTELIFSEEKMIGEYFAGTCDCVLKINDGYYLIDFKTSNHMSYNYTLQMAAYRYLLKTVKGIDIDGAIILKLDKENSEFTEYVIDIKNNPAHASYMDKCLETFMLLVSAYRMRFITEKEYDEFNDFRT